MTEKKKTINPENKKSAAKKVEAKKRLEKAALTEKAAASAQKKGDVPPLKESNGLPEGDASSGGLETVETDRGPKGKAESDAQDRKSKNILDKTDRKTIHKQEEHYYDEVSSLIDSIIFDEDKDEKVDKIEEKVSEIERGTAGVLGGLKDRTGNDETPSEIIPSSMDTEKVEDKSEADETEAGVSEIEPKIAEHVSGDLEVRDEIDGIRKEATYFSIEVGGISDKTEKADIDERDVSEIKRKIEDVFREFEDGATIDEKRPEIIPLSLETGGIEKKTKAVDNLEGEGSEIEGGRTEVPGEFEDRVEIHENRRGVTHFSATTKTIDVKTEKIHIPRDAGKTRKRGVESVDGEKVEKNFSRIIYIAAGILIVLLAGMALFIFRPLGDINTHKIPEMLVSHQSDTPSREPQTQKEVQPEENADFQESSPAGNHTVPSREAVKVEKPVSKTEEEIRYKESKSVDDDAVSSQEILQAEKRVSMPERAIGVSDEINEFLMKWRIAWQNTAGEAGDIETYMSFYSNDFVSKGLDKNRWRTDKANKNRKKDWIRVELKNIVIQEPVINNQVELSFIQDYQSSNYSIESDKTLILKKEETGWKIIDVRTAGDR